MNTQMRWLLNKRKNPSEALMVEINVREIDHQEACIRGIVRLSTHETLYIEAITLKLQPCNRMEMMGLGKIAIPLNDVIRPNENKEICFALPFRQQQISSDEVCLLAKVSAFYDEAKPNHSVALKLS